MHWVLVQTCIGVDMPWVAPNDCLHHGGMVSVCVCVCMRGHARVFVFWAEGGNGNAVT